MTDNQTFLEEYVARRSEAAFRELVARYMDLVYGTALRSVGGHTAQAEDVAQTVFVDLARLARGFSREVKLGGWLHRHTCYVAANAVRAERRRQSRERQSFEMNSITDDSQARLAEVAPILDEAINQLGAADRTAIVLRFYERLDFRAVGVALGASEAAAQKRVNRAVGKLHVLLRRRGVTLSLTALGAVLAGEAVSAAPPGLAAAITGTALAGAGAGTANTITLLKLMVATKLKTGAVAAIILACVVAPLLMQHQAEAGLREQDEAQRRQAQQITQLAADNQRMAALLDQARNTPPPPDGQFRELLRRRGEVGRLREAVAKTASEEKPVSPGATDQLASLKQLYAARAEKLKQWFEDNPDKKIPELKSVSDALWIDLAAQMQSDDDLPRVAGYMRDDAAAEVLGALGGALRRYIKDTAGQFPTDLSQLEPYLKSPIDDSILQRFAIVPAGSLVNELQTGSPWVITQIAPPADPALDEREAVGLTDVKIVRAGPQVPNRWSTVPAR